jgi:hypothetical protein
MNDERGNVDRHARSTRAISRVLSDAIVDSQTNALQPSSSLNQINNQDDDRNDKQEMDQAAANVAEEAKKPEHDQDDNDSPEHGVIPFG